MKKLMCILLSAVMVLGLIPVTAAADAPTYNDIAPKNELEVRWGDGEGEGNGWYRDSGRAEPDDNLPQGVSFDAQTSTLTLKGADISFIRAADWGENKLTIKVEGENHIRSYHGRDGIELRSCHDVTIEGSGTLNVEVAGKNDDPVNPSYGTPLGVWDWYLVDRGEGYNGQDDHVYPSGTLTIDGVTVNLTNPEDEYRQFYGEVEYRNAQSMNVLIANMELKGGAKVTAKGMERVYMSANLTIGKDCEMTVDTMEFNGILDQDKENVIKTTLTVNGKLTATGDRFSGIEGIEENENVRDIYGVSLHINPGAKLVLNDGGVIDITAPKLSYGCGLSISSPAYDDDNDPKNKLGAAKAEINGGTITVNGAKDGISVDAGATWTQSAGTVTVNVDGDRDDWWDMSSGLGVNGYTDHPEDTAKFIQTGGTVTVNMSMGKPTVFVNENNPDGDGTEYGPGVHISGSAEYDISGSAKLNVNYTGTGNGWFPGVKIEANYNDQGQPVGKGGTMKVSGNATVNVDYTGFSGMDEITGISGFSVENESTLNVETGGTVTVTLPGGSVGDATGISLFESTVTTGGNITVTAPKGMTTNSMVGFNLGRDVENEEEKISKLTVSGGTVDIELKAVTRYVAVGISAGEGSQVSFEGGEVKMDIGGDKLNNEDWSGAVGLELWNESEATVKSGAKLDFKVSRTTGERTGVKISGRSTYKQVEGSEVTLNSIPDGDLRYESSAGMEVSDYSTVTLNGTLTVLKDVDVAVILTRSSIEIGTGAKLIYNALDSETGDGIILSDYSNLTMAEGEIDIDVPIVARNPSDDGSYWMTGGFNVGENSTAVITGGKININQNEARGTGTDDFYTVGLQVSNGFLRVMGGELNLRGLYPLSAINSLGSSDLITLGEGIIALYANGTEYGDEDLSGFEVERHVYTYVTQYGVDINYFDYVLDPEVETPSGEFNMTVKAGSAKAKYSAILELVNSGSVIAGQEYTARLTASLPEGSDTVTLSVDNGKVVNGSVSVNGKIADKDTNNVTYGEDEGTASLTVQSGDIVRFTVIPGAKENTIKAEFEKANETASAPFTAKGYALELPTSTDKATVTVSGVAAKDTEVKIFVDSVQSGDAVTANQAGVWSTTITLANEGEHTVYATIGNNRTDSKTITYKSTLPVVESLTVTNWIHGRTSADPNVESTFVIDFADPSKAPRYYTYWPELPEFTFTVKFSQGADRVADVRVIATDWQGNEETVYLSLDTGTMIWTGTHEFGVGDHITPEQFRVVWRNLDGTEGQTPETYEEPKIPDSAWGDPKVEGDVYTPPEYEDNRTGKRLETVTVEPGKYDFTVTDGAEVKLVSPEGGTLDGSGTSYSVTGKDGDMYVVTVKNDSDEYTLCIYFESTGGGDGQAYVLAETAAQDDDANVTVGGDYTASDADKGKTLEYLIVGSRVYRLEKKADSEDTYTVKEDVTEKEDLDITKVYKSFSVSGFRGADWDNATLVEWDGEHSDLLVGSVGSVPATYHINYATGEVTVDADTEAIAREFMSTQLAADLIDSAINVWEKDIDRELIDVEGVNCTVKLHASFDVLGETLGKLTVKPEFTITVGTKTKGHFGTISETLTVKVGFESVTSVDYRLTMKRDKDGNVEGFIPKYSGYISVSEDMSFTLGFSVSIKGQNTGTEEDVLSKYFAETELEKYLDELEKYQNKDTILPTAKVYIPIPAVPGLGFYFGSSLYYNYKLLGELSVNSEIKTGLKAGLVIADNEVISRTGDLEPVEQTTDLKFHAEAGAGVGIRGDFGLSLLRVLEVGVYGQAGPRVDIKGHGHAAFGTNKSTEFDAEIGIALGLEAKVGTAIAIKILNMNKRESLDFWTTYFTQPDWTLGRKFMPTKFTVREKEPTIVPAEVNLSTVIDMNISYQELVGSYDVKSKIMDADKYEFQLYESEGKPVTLTKNGDLTVTDKTQSFDFWVKVLYKVHPDDEYQVWKIGPLRYTPAVIEVVKTTEEGGPRVASFTVTDTSTSTQNSETKTTSDAGLAVFGAVPGHTYIITENSCPAGYYPATTSKTVTVEGEKEVVNFLNRKIKDPEPEEPQAELQATPNVSVSCCEDPSGYVYEGIESNRLKDVKTTLYYKATDGEGEGEVWKAGDYDQENPLTTDVLGQYMWMVPSGYWRVEYELEGYDTQYSDWMSVPPVRTGVNQNMISSEPAEVTLEYSEILGCYILRFSRPVQVETVLDNIKLDISGDVESSVNSLYPLDADWSVVGGDVKDSTLCATTFRFGSFSAWEVIRDEDGNEIDQKDYPLPVDTQVTVKVSGVLTYKNEPSEDTAEIAIHEPPANKFRVTVIGGSGSGLYTPGEEVKLTYEVRSDYTFTGWSVVEPIDTEDSIVISGNTFVMPECDVVIKAEYKENGGGGSISGGGNGGASGSAGSDSVTISESVENGSVTANYQSAAPGTTVTITVKPDSGYVLGKLTVTDSAGKEIELTDNGDGTYSFEMPEGGVKITAVFKCDGGEACLSRRFTDLDPKAWYHEYTDYVIGKDLIDGVGDGLFDPNGTVSRAQMVTLLWNLKGKPVVNYYMTYPDVSEDDWWAEAVRWATSEGVVEGYDNGKFGPTDLINREQMATMLYNYEKKYGGGLESVGQYELPFTDAAKVSPWALEAVTWCSKEEIITGKPGNVFDPFGTATRCEMAGIIAHYCQKDTADEE